MITETQTRVIVLQLTDEQLAQLQPFMAGLDIIATAHNVEHASQRLTMRGDHRPNFTQILADGVDFERRTQEELQIGG